MMETAPKKVVLCSVAVVICCRRSWQFSTQRWYVPAMPRTICCCSLTAMAGMRSSETMIAVLWFLRVLANDRQDCYMLLHLDGQ